VGGGGDGLLLFWLVLERQIMLWNVNVCLRNCDGWMYSSTLNGLTERDTKLLDLRLINDSLNEDYLKVKKFRLYEEERKNKDRDLTFWQTAILLKFAAI